MSGPQSSKLRRLRPKLSSFLVILIQWWSVYLLQKISDFGSNFPISVTGSINEPTISWCQPFTLQICPKQSSRFRSVVFLDEKGKETFGSMINHFISFNFVKLNLCQYFLLIWNCTLTAAWLTWTRLDLIRRKIFRTFGI